MSPELADWRHEAATMSIVEASTETMSIIGAAESVSALSRSKRWFGHIIVATHPSSRSLLCSRTSASTQRMLNMVLPNLHPCLPPCRVSATEGCSPQRKQDPECNAAIRRVALAETPHSSSSWRRDPSHCAMDIPLRLPGQLGRKPSFSRSKNKAETLNVVQSQRCDGPCRLRGLAQCRTLMQNCDRSSVGRTLFLRTVAGTCNKPRDASHS